MQPLQAVDFNLKQIGDAYLCFNSFRAPRYCRNHANVEFFTQTTHHCRISKVVDTHIQLASHVLLCFRKSACFAKELDRPRTR